MFNNIKNITTFFRQFIVLLSLCFNSLEVFSQVKADFDAVIKNGCSPLEVTFTNKSTGTNLTYNWILGNGNTSTLPNPYAIYTADGYYDVKLIVTDGVSTDSITKIKFIHVFRNPEPNLEALDKTLGCVPFTVNFKNTTIVGDIPISQWKWDFGDGTTSTDFQPTHNYLVAGAFDVKLTVIDQLNCKGFVNVEKYITAEQVKVNFSATNTKTCSAGLAAAFQNLTADTIGVAFKWYFGDGGTATDFAPVHKYTELGSYTVGLVGVNQHGCRDSVAIDDYISILGVVPSFTVSREIACRNENLVFKTSTQNATEYKWNFGDGTSTTSYTQTNQNHTYTKTGNYKVTLQISLNDECTDSISKTINIEYVKADFVSPAFSCQLPATSRYTDKSVNVASWSWHFGSGHSSNLQNPVDNIISFTNGSSYKQFFIDTLIVTSPHGCKDMIIRDSSAVVILPVAMMSPRFPDVTGLSGCIPKSINFKDESYYESKLDKIASRLWDFGDGETSTQAQPVKVFNKVGNYMVNLTVTTEKGCKSVRSELVSVGTPKTATFVINTPDTVCANQIITFTCQTTHQDSIDSYSWHFAEGLSTLGGLRAYHVYNSIGAKLPSLVVTSFGCPSIFSKADSIHVLGPAVSITKSSDCNKPFDYVFSAKLEDAKSYSWDLGDTTSIVNDIQSVAHTYKYRGNYKVKLKANTDKCSAEDSVIIKVRNLKADFEWNKNIACVGETFAFDGSISRDEETFSYNNKLNKYLWSFSDENRQVFASSPVIYTFNKRGVHQVTLTVKDSNLCSASITKSVKIFQPKPDFQSAYQKGCIPVSFSFTDNSISDTTITKWTWLFGDKTSDNESNPTHEYSKFGSYDVSLILIDKLGCTDTIQKKGFITVQKPDPSFAVADRTLCVGDTARFSINSHTQIANVLWDFGNGKTSNLRSAQNPYLDSGYYTVKLHITDTHGCDTTGTKTKYISVQKYPVANFVADKVETNCYPALINFFDNTEGKYVTSWKWNFGDDLNTSAQQNPRHTYTKPGDFNIFLISYTSNGCADTIVKPSYVYVKGPWAKIVAADTTCKNVLTTLIASEKVNVYKLKWDLGNGILATTDTIKTIYTTWNTVYPTLLLYSDENHTCDKAIVDSINVYKVVAGINVNNNLPEGCVPFHIKCQSESQKANFYSWYLSNQLQPATTASFEKTIATAGEYPVKLIIHNTFGCYDTIVQKVTAFPLPTVSISKPNFICRGNTIELFAGGGTQYSWKPTKGLNNSLIDKPIAQPDSSIEYTVTVTDANHCKSDSSVFITVQQIPKVNLRDTSIVIGEIVSLNVTDKAIKTYSWAPDIDISCTNCPVLTFKPLESTRYIVTVSDTSSCFSREYAISIDIMKKYSVDVPEVFTPNGDGINDIVYVRGWGIKELMLFRIFNRFGAMIFETTDLANGWDGTYKGAIQNVETFTYIVQIKSYQDDIIVKKGFIKLMR